MGTTTIDEAISENDGIIPEMIKIDAEGFDLKVLEGAQLALGKTDVIFCEAAVICPFDNKLASICNYMTDYCYRLVKITDLNDSPNNEMLYLVELVFFKEGSPLDGAYITRSEADAGLTLLHHRGARRHQTPIFPKLRYYTRSN